MVRLPDSIVNSIRPTQIPPEKKSLGGQVTLDIDGKTLHFDMRDPRQKALYEQYTNKQFVDIDNAEALRSRVDPTKEDLSDKRIGQVTTDVIRSVAGKGSFRSAVGQHGGGLKRPFDDRLDDWSPNKK